MATILLAQLCLRRNVHDRYCVVCDAMCKTVIAQVSMYVNGHAYSRLLEKKMYSSYKKQHIFFFASKRLRAPAIAKELRKEN